MIYLEKPENFDPSFEVVGNFIQCDGYIILLHRQDHKPEGGTWGIPSGKIDPGETMSITAHRETKEETGLIIPEENFKFFKTVYVRYPTYDFVYHMFSLELNEKFAIMISEKEHKESQWIKPQEAFNLPLIEDLDVCLKLFFNL